MKNLGRPKMIKWLLASAALLTVSLVALFATTSAQYLASGTAHSELQTTAPASPTAVTVSLPTVSVSPGSSVTIPITVSDLTGLGVRAYDLQVTFDPLIVQPQATPFDSSGTISSGMLITPNANNAGHLILSAFQSTDLSGTGTLLKLKFTVVGTPGQSTSLAFQDYTDPNTVFHPAFRFNAGNPQATTTNGSISVNAPPTITPTPVTRQAGSSVSNSTIATVNDTESGPGGVTVTVTSANPSNGVTVSNIVNTTGTVTADVVAACGATAASFTLLATDGGGATATATLNVTVNANSVPTLVYTSPQNVIFGGALNVTPTTATDNGSITSYSVQSVVPALTTAPTVNGSGVVSITNAQPSGSHVITIRATDNCGLTTDAQFTLDVGAVPSFAIDDVTHNEGNAGTTSYTFTVTKSGSTAVNASVDYATVNGTATSPADFAAISTTTLTFLPADTTKQFTVLVNGDTTFEPNETFTVHLSNASVATISDADGTGTISNDDSPSISGHLVYGDTLTPVRNVTMTLTAPSFTTQITTTDINGNYTFASVPAGNNYTLTPSKTSDVNGLESFDASFVARYAVGLDLPTANQRIAADADGDAIITSFDASLIARAVAGLPGIGIVGTWKFVPVSRSYPALGGDQTNQNFAAILVGDTSSSWLRSVPSGDGLTFGNSLTSPDGIPSVAVSLPNLTGLTPSLITVPITVGNLTGQGVKAYDLQVTFDSTRVLPDTTPFDTAGTRSSGMAVTPNANNPGHLIISAFQATDLTGSGILINLKFVIVGNPGQSTPLTFENYTDPGTIFHPGFRFNAGTPAANTTNGSVTINGPSAAAGTVSGQIIDSTGSPVGGAAVRLNGTQNRLTVTDGEGKYHFDNVETTGFYTVTPSRANYVFSPAQRSFSQLGEHTDAFFTASSTGTGVNPVDTAEYFVRQHYLDFLGREPDEGGLNFWSDQILMCGADRVCLERRTLNVSAAYFLSIEFQQTGGLVDGLYRASYGRRPLFAEFMPDTATIARDVVVGRAGWAQLLESNKQAFIDAWMQRPAFSAAYDGLANDRFVDELVSHTRVNFTEGEREALVSGLSSGAMTRAEVLRRIVEDERFVIAKRNEAFVMMEYFGYLRRDPDESGYQFWLRKLNEFNGNFERAEMVRAFLVSGEFRQRFR